MGALGNLVPLVILFGFVGAFAWVGYQVCSESIVGASLDRVPILMPLHIYLYSNQLADRGVRKMEKKNIVFTKDGAKVGVKEIKAEDYADRTQRCAKTWLLEGYFWVRC